MKQLLLLIVLLIPFSFALQGYDAPRSGFSADSNVRVLDTAVYNTGYLSEDGSDWQAFTLTGTTRGDWIVGEATSNTDLSSARYVAIFSCSWSSGWSCGSTWQVRDRGDPSAQHYLVQNGVAQADIVVSPDAPNMVVLAAEYFQNDIEEMTGALLPIRNAPGNDYDFHVYIGESQYTQALGIDASATEYDGYKIVSGENYLVMLGDDTPYDYEGEMTQAEWDALIAPDTWMFTYPERRGYHRDVHIHEQDGRGSMNAIHQFLRDQGMRYYYPTEYGIITPQKSDIRFTNYNTLKNPDFKMRTFTLYFKDFQLIDNQDVYPDDHPYGGGDEWLRYVLSIGKNSHQKIITGRYAHGIDTILEHPETKANHPEYYAVIGGVRRNGENFKPDFCSEGLKQEAVRYAKTLIETFDTEYINLWPTDGFTAASESSQECKDRETPERGNDGKLSDYVWNFMNDVAWEVHDEYGEEHKILSGAYGHYKLPPTEITNPRGLAPNLASMIVMSVVDYATPENEQLRRQTILDWQEITPGEVFLNDKYLKNWYDRKTTNTIPYLYPRMIADDLKENKGKSNGGRHETATTSNRHDPGWDTYGATGPNVYVHSRLYWDTSTDVDALLDEYYTLYYGPAENTMRSLYEYSEEHLAELTVNPNHQVYMRELARQAMTEVPSGSEYELRVEDMLDLINGQYEGDEVEISSCQTLDSPATTYFLTQDLVTNDVCFFIDQQGITLDCQENTITGSGEHIIELNARQSGRGHYFTLRNCVLKNSGDVRAGAWFAHGDNLHIHDNVFEMTGSNIGLWIRNSFNSNIHDNIIQSESDRALYSQHGDNDMVTQTTYENNDVYSRSADAVIMFGVSGDILKNNTFHSQEAHGLRMTYPLNTQILDNTIQSDVTNALSLSNTQNTTVEGNTIING